MAGHKIAAGCSYENFRLGSCPSRSGAENIKGFSRCDQTVPEELDSGIRIAKLLASTGVMGRSSFRWSCAAGSVVAIQRVLVAALIIWALVAAVPGVQGDAGSDFLDEKETQVVLIAKQVEVNDAQTCELVQSCSGSGNCSRYSCWPLLGESFECVDVTNNKYCTSQSGNGTCTQVRADYSKSYIRLPPFAARELTSLPVQISNSICSQRQLDPTFQNISAPTSFNLIYFGAVDGSFRGFPGREENMSDCLNYDPRIRPWYTAGISVTKVLVVLIDDGPSMTNTLPAGFQLPITYLAAAQNIAQQLLQTVSAQDYVNIIMFNSGGSFELSAGGPVLVKGNVTSDPNDHPELDPLEAALLNQTGSNQQGPSNLTAAIESAFSNFNANPYALKVIVVLTDAGFASSENVTLPETQLQAAGVKVLIYKLPQANDNNVYLSNIPLLGSLCRIGGTFEVIEQNLVDPLYAIKSYFSYLASTHMVAPAVAGKPLWTSLYLDFDEISKYITTVTFPAFGADGQLLGVAGIDVYIDELGNLTDLVTNALQNRSNEGSIYPTVATLNQLNCSVANATSPVSAAQRCGSTKLPANGGLCEQTDLTSSFESIECSCSTCSSFQLVSTSKSKHHVEIVGLSVGAGVAVLLILAIVTFICCSRCNYYGSCWTRINRPSNEDTVTPPNDSPNRTQSPPTNVPSDESDLQSTLPPVR